MNITEYLKISKYIKRLETKPTDFRLAIMPIALVGLILVILTGRFPKIAEANAFSASVYPSVTKVRIVSGESIQSKIEVRNLENRAIVLEAVFKPFRASAESDGFPEYYDDQETQRFINNNIKLVDKETETTKFTLEPGQKKDLELAISASKSAQQKDYYFTIIFVETPQSRSYNIKGSQVTIIGGIGSNILLSVGSKNTEIGGAIRIDNLKVPALTLRSPIEFEARISNNSRHFKTVNGYMTITNIFGQTIGKIDIGEIDILSHSSRNLLDKEGKNISWNEPFTLGTYKASLILYENKDRSKVERTTSTVSIPAKHFTLAGAVTIALTLLVYKVRHRIID